MSDYLWINPLNLAHPRLARAATISVPIAVHTEYFRWQLDLFWHAHRAVYGETAHLKSHAVVIKRNDFWEPKTEAIGWNIDIPHTMCEAFFDIPIQGLSLMHSTLALAVPLNIQFGLLQVLPQLDDGQVVEVIDCDMFHFRPSPQYEVGPNEILVADIYENWHLFSRSQHRDVIEPYFQNGGRYYNGGFVPIISRVDTLRRLVPEWIGVHVAILLRPHETLIHWWAGMYALQAACERLQIEMRGIDCCYAPPANELQPSHYIGHYCADQFFTKKTFPNVTTQGWPDSPYYRLIKQWLQRNGIH